MRGPGTRTSVSRLAPLAVALAAAALAPAAAAQRGTGAATALLVSGHGFGQGVGLSQWGAELRAAAGQTTAQILRFYYPGTHPARARERTVRVLVGAGPSVRVGSRAPFTVRTAAGSTVRLPAGLYTVGPRGIAAGRDLPLPAVVRPGAAPLRLAGTGFAGSLALSARNGRVRVVNTVGLEDYLDGVVSSECPGNWRPAALRAQAIASRSYALANLRPDRYFDLYPDDRSQNYHGLARRWPAAVAAVAATRGQVLRDRAGAVVDAMFSAANGGLTAVPDGIWSDNPSPSYFVSRPDPFDAAGPDTDWGPVTISHAELRQAFPRLPEAITGVRVVRNAGRRAVRIVFTSSDGRTVSLRGYTFQQRLRLRSTYLSVRSLASGPQPARSSSPPSGPRVPPFASSQRAASVRFETPSFR